MPGRVRFVEGINGIERESRSSTDPERTLALYINLKRPVNLQMNGKYVWCETLLTTLRNLSNFPRFLIPLVENASFKLVRNISEQ